MTPPHNISMLPVEASSTHPADASPRAAAWQCTQSHAALPAAANWTQLPADIIGRCVFIAQQQTQKHDEHNAFLFQLGRMGSAFRNNQTVQAGTVGHLASKLTAENFEDRSPALLNSAVAITEPVAFHAALCSILRLSRRVEPHQAAALWESVYKDAAANRTQARKAITLRALAERLPPENSYPMRYKIDRDARELGIEAFAQHSMARAKAWRVTGQDAVNDGFILLARTDEFRLQPATAKAMLLALSKQIYSEAYWRDKSAKSTLTNIFSATHTRVDDLPLNDRIEPSQHLMAATYHIDPALHQERFLQQCALVESRIREGNRVDDASVNALAKELIITQWNMKDAERVLWSRVMDLCELHYAPGSEMRRSGAHLAILKTMKYAHANFDSAHRVRRMLRFADLSPLAQDPSKATLVATGLDDLFKATAYLEHHDTEAMAAWDCVAAHAYSQQCREHTRFSTALASLKGSDWSVPERYLRYQRTYKTLQSIRPTARYRALHELVTNFRSIRREDAVAVIAQLHAIATALSQELPHVAAGLREAFASASAIARINDRDL